MPNRQAPSWLFRLVACLLAGSASAQQKPRVPEGYQKFFVHYQDSRSYLEKVLNSIDLSSQDVGRSLALLAGVSQYPNMPVLDRQLRPASEDLSKLQDYLAKYEFFDEIVVLRDQDFTTENLEFFLQVYFPSRLQKFPKSRFLFAFSGHGTTAGTEGSTGYLLKNSARSLDDRENSISLKVVRALFDEIVENGHHVLALLNACFSGAFIRRSFGSSSRFLPNLKGAHAITAGGSKELTWHDPEVGSGSIFFEKLLAGLGGPADSLPKNSDGSSGDGVIAIEELAAYLKREVQISTDEKQNPQVSDISKNGSQGGFFFLNRSRQVNDIPPRMTGRVRTPFGVEAERALLEGKAYYRSKDYEAALRLMKQAAGAGHDEAMTYAGYMYFEGLGTQPDYRQAFYWFERAAAQRNASAMNNLGFMYADGLGVSRNLDEAVAWYRKAVDGGDPGAMFNLGYLYQKGLGVKTDHAEALRLFRSGAELGEAKAMNALGFMHYSGLGVGQDYMEARTWYRRAAQAGEPSAMFNLGHLYENGLGERGKDYSEAARWYRQAADAGSTSAMNNLARLYNEGLGVVRDVAEALRLFRMSARAGNTSAMNNLGYMYEKGRGVRSDRGEAFGWYRKAADAGDSHGMYNVGRLLEEGRGVPKDLDAAIRWYREAAFLGHEKARQRLVDLRVSPS